MRWEVHARRFAGPPTRWPVAALQQNQETKKRVVDTFQVRRAGPAGGRGPTLAPRTHGQPHQADLEEARAQIEALKQALKQAGAGAEELERKNALVAKCKETISCDTGRRGG